MLLSTRKRAISRASAARARSAPRRDEVERRIRKPPCPAAANASWNACFRRWSLSIFTKDSLICPPAVSLEICSCQAQRRFRTRSSALPAAGTGSERRASFNTSAFSSQSVTSPHVRSRSTICPREARHVLAKSMAGCSPRKRKSGADAVAVATIVLSIAPARLSHLKSYVPELDSGIVRPLPRNRTRSSRFRILRGSRSSGLSLAQHL